MPRAFSSLLLVLAATLLSSGARCQQRSIAVVLISAPSEPLDMDRLQDTLQAHMSDLDAEVAVRAVMDLPSDPETQKDVARALIREAHALSAIWVAPQNDTLMLLVSDHGTEQMLSRSLSRRPDDSDQVYDAAASIVRAALIPWFSSDDSPPPEPPSAVTTPLRKSSALENEQDVTARSGSKTAPRAHRGPTAQLALRGAYALDGDLSDAISHGGDIGAGVFLFGQLLLSADLSIFQAEDLDIPEHDIRLLRLPIRIQAALFVNLSRHVLFGIGAALVLDIERIRGADESSAPDDIQRVRIGFSPSLLLRVFPSPRFSIDLQSGVDIFGEDHHYRWDNETVLTNGRTHTGGTIGVTFYFPASAQEVNR